MLAGGIAWGGNDHFFAGGMISPEDFRHFLQAHAGICSFVGAAVWGNSVTVFLATAAGQGLASWWWITVFSAFGNFTRDIVIFLLGRTSFAARITQSKRIAHTYQKLHGLRRRYPGKDWLVFILVKYIYGARILAILYFGSIRYAWRRFLTFDLIGVILLTLLLTFCGWGMGKGIGLYVNIFKTLQSTATAAVICILVMVGIRRLARHGLETDR